MHATLSAVCLLMVGHWLGDFVLQWNELAVKKRTSIGWLGLHVLLYTLVIQAVAFYLLPLIAAVQFGVVNGILHFVTDVFTRKLTARYTEVPRKLFIAIGFDQLVHTIALISLLEYYWPT